MIRLLVAAFLIGLLAVGAYAGYWFFVAGRIEAEADEWTLSREAEGWIVARQGLVVGNFPLAHQIRIDGLDITAPPGRGGWAVAIERVEIEAAAPWNLTSWTLRPRSDVRLRLEDGEEALLQAAASNLRLESGRAGVTHFYAEAQDLAVAAPTAPLQAAETIYVQGDREGGAWRVLFETRGALIAESALRDARSAFGPQVQVLALDVQAQEEGLASLAAGLAGLSDAGDLTVNAARLEWGEAILSGQGAVGVEADGRLRGNFDVAVADAAAFFGALAGGGVLSARDANVAVAALAFFPTDEQDRTLIPLSFRDGDTYLGPISVGPAPLVVGRNPAPSIATPPAASDATLTPPDTQTPAPETPDAPIPPPQ